VGSGCGVRVTFGLRGCRGVDAMSTAAVNVNVTDRGAFDRFLRLRSASSSCAARARHPRSWTRRWCVS
jgi:citrate lyase gamma subunit